MTDHALTTTRAPMSGTVFEAMFLTAARMARAIRREVEIARATRAMAGMPDHMLKDLGISRDQIDLAARFGRGEHGRRYL